MTDEDSAARSTTTCAYQAESGTVCDQPSLEDGDMCIWHAELPDKVLAGDVVVNDDTEIDEPQLGGAILRRVDLSGIRFVGGDFSGATFEDADITDATFQDSILDTAEFTNCRLSDSRFEGCQMTAARVRDTHLRNAAFVSTDCQSIKIIDSDLSAGEWKRTAASEATLDGVEAGSISLKEADFSRSTIRQSTLTDADCSRADFSAAVVRGSDLTDASFQEADATGIEATLSTFTGATFRGSGLAEAHFVDCDLEEAEFETADVTDSLFEDCILSRGSWVDAILTDAELIQSDLDDAVFKRANCTETSFEESDLTGVDFGGADLFGVLLGGADLRHVDFDARTTVEHVYEYGPQNGEYRLDVVIFRALANAFSRCGLSREASMFRYRTKRAERAAAFDTVRTGDSPDERLTAASRWIGLSTAGLISGYGERPSRIVTSAIWVIVSFALMYTFVGGEAITSATNTSTLVRALTLSFAAFTGVNSAPTVTTVEMQLLVNIESLVGLGYVVLFVFTLSRRTTDL